jgi:hypothetical protein
LLRRRVTFPEMSRQIDVVVYSERLRSSQGVGTKESAVMVATVDVLIFLVKVDLHASK